MTRVKQLFRYAGSKAKLLTAYAPFFEGLQPQHCVDYFGGSGTMSLWFHQLYPEAKLYLNEKDPALYSLFKCIQDEYDDVCLLVQVYEEDYRRCHDFESMKKFYYDIRDNHYNVAQDPLYKRLKEHPEEYKARARDIEKLIDKSYGFSLREFYSKRGKNEAFIEQLYQLSIADEKDILFENAAYFLLRKLSFSGMNVRNAQGEYTSAAGIVRRNAPYTDPEMLAAFKAMLDHTELFNADYRALDFHLPRTLHFFDPPYYNASKNLYPSYFGWDETAELCEYIQRVSEHSTVFMSNYDHPQLKKLMKGFHWYVFPPGRTLKRSQKEPVREILFYKIHPSIAG
jgi:site-specific DNA-adenine methylase